MTVGNTALQPPPEPDVSGPQGPCDTRAPLSTRTAVNSRDSPTGGTGTATATDPATDPATDQHSDRAQLTPGAPGTRRTPPVRLRALDGLRLLAALMVAAYHYGGRDGEISEAWGSSPGRQFPSLSQLFAYGCLGVQIFFIISGFVICMSGWGRPLRHFFASRVSRLFPAYWAAVILVTAVFALPWIAYEAVSPSDALVNLTMLQQPLGVDRVLGVCWTLWAEVRFYALFALFVVLPGASRQRVVLFCALWTLGAAIAATADLPVLDIVLMPEYAPFFIGGVGLYLIHRFGHDVTAWGIVGFSWLLGQHYAVDRLWHPPDPDYFSYRSSLTIVAVVTLGFAAVAAVALGKLRWADWRWLTVAGALTYPFYLVHEHLGWVTVAVLHRGLGLPAWLVFPLTIGTMLLLAWLLHRFVERPLAPKVRNGLLRSAKTSGSG
ncbi:acyltransferase family protein [Streptomyces sp. H27-D2]|uniref:acyltransferase family protein n=1 Tax=Streptomyces sp. H27-D2 TaxID=3046304 RepID=UPI002DBC71EF|nr:acyltransferase [Streptomyces sp. H27-D2]MEC4015930.1 acyltransferase [Streptomyces sp. H27-D2]